MSEIKVSFKIKIIHVLLDIDEKQLLGTRIL